MRRRSSFAAQAGAGLTEIMIAMVLGLLVAGMVFQVFLGARRNFNLQGDLATRQETARFAVNMLTRDLYMAGYRGCLRDSGTVRNTLNDSTSFLYDFAIHVQGFNAQGGGWSPALPASVPAKSAGNPHGVLPGTDVLTIRTVDDPGVFVTQPMASVSANPRIIAGLNPPPLANGDIVLITDCGGAAIFQISNYAVASGEIAHETGGTSPGNATNNLGRRFDAGAQLFRLRTTTYYIADSQTDVGRPALWRRIGTEPAQELAPGVENMQVEYGEDTDGDRVPDVFRTANLVTDWEDVTAVRISLLIASINGQATDADPRKFNLLGVEVGPFDDGRLRRVMTTTIALRNRLQ